MDAVHWFDHNRAMTVPTIGLAPFDEALRLIAIGEMLMVALVVARSGASVAIRRGTVLLLAGVIGYLIESVDTTSAPAGLANLVEELASTSTAIALWLFAHALFERRADWRIAAAAGAILGGIVVANSVNGHCYPAQAWLIRLGHAIVAVLVIHAMIVAVNSRADDLSEKRRRFALAFVGVVAGEALVVVMGQAWFGALGEPVELRLVEAMLIVAAGLAIGGALLEADGELIGTAAPSAGEAITDTAGLAPAERVLRDRLDKAMAAGAWQQPGLTIGDLARTLGVPEHRLRALINRRLGHRNFSSFLNVHRIAEAKVRLADPDHVALPVLTIAMDLGYGSLAPFNRAFRDATGQTPTDFRRAAFAEDAAANL